MATDISIRRARPGDEHALALVGQATFLETFSGVLDGAAIVEHCHHAHSALKYGHWLGDPDAAVWLAEANPGSAPIGYAVVARPELPMADLSTDLELKRIYLLGRYHGAGIGRQLIGEAIAHTVSARAARLLLGVYAGNAPAIDFYSRQGFVHLTERQFKVGGRAYDDRVMCLAVGS
jgi:ribosomal protein S18 acetylase RimI-like enzyme